MLAFLLHACEVVAFVLYVNANVDVEIVTTAVAFMFLMGGATF